MGAERSATGGRVEPHADKLTAMAQYRGHVKWFNNAKGFGFLGREGGPDVFVHYASIEQEGYRGLKEDEEVEFDIIQGAKGPQADRVVRLSRVRQSSAETDLA